MFFLGKIKSGIRGELSSCSWHEKWTECPFLVRWRLLQKQFTCNSRHTQYYNNHVSVTSENNMYSKSQTHSYQMDNTLQYPMPIPKENSMYRISHPENHIYYPHRQGLGYTGGMGMGSHMRMSDAQEQMDYVGGRGRMTMFGYRHRGGKDMLSHFREAND